MEVMEQAFEDAIQNGTIPGVQLTACSRDGHLDYFKCFGKAGLEPDAALMSADSSLCLASATKLVTCVAAMQCVERGLIGLDDAVSAILPEFALPFILKGFEEDGGKPILEPATKVITLRHFLTHTSGLANFEEEIMSRYFISIGDDKGTLLERFFMSDDVQVRDKALPEILVIMSNLEVHPLTFEPGSDWCYSQGTDWAGQMVERVTGMTLEEYSQVNIFQPLSMKNTTYRLLKHPHIHAHLMPLLTRTKTGTLAPIPSIYPLDPATDMGGSNLYTTAADFLALLRSLLRDDCRLLAPATNALMLDARLHPQGLLGPEKLGLAPDLRVDHCLAGLVNESTTKQGQLPGTVSWRGATKCYWWLDRAAGICGFVGTQLIGIHDKGIMDGMYDSFVTAVNENYIKP